MKLDDFKEIANILPDYMLIIDQNYNIVFSNKAFLDYCGITEKDIINKKYYEFMHRCTRPCKEIQDIICPRDDTEGSIIRYHIMPDGTERIFDIKAIKVKDEKGDNLTIEIMRDITERERFREELQKKRKENPGYTL